MKLLVCTNHMMLDKKQLSQQYILFHIQGLDGLPGDKGDDGDAGQPVSDGRC